MSANPRSDARFTRPRKPAASPPSLSTVAAAPAAATAHPGYPTTFFLKSETELELERTAQQPRGRRTSRAVQRSQEGILPLLHDVGDCSTHASHDTGDCSIQSPDHTGHTTTRLSSTNMPDSISLSSSHDVRDRIIPSSNNTRDGIIHSSHDIGDNAPLSSDNTPDSSIQSSHDIGHNTSPSSNDTPESLMHSSHDTEGTTTPPLTNIRDSTFGVQSLEETIRESLHSNRTSTSSHVDSNDGNRERPLAHSPDLLARVNSRKRKAGNPVHPSIRSAGHRILSSDQHSPSVASPASLRSADSHSHSAGSHSRSAGSHSRSAGSHSRSADSPFQADSPFRPSELRSRPSDSHLPSSNLHSRASYSSLNLARSFTPLRASPLPESALPSTPRSVSLRSFALSDEEISMTSDTNSHAVQSSSEEDEDFSPPSHGQEQPQLVMPSISMPTRRPFTPRGRNMGRLKIMLLGPSGIGKSSLIKSICRVCNDIVHVDPISASRPVDSLPASKPTRSNANGKASSYEPTTAFAETYASTKPYPLWWSDMESSRILWRRKSFGEGVLERNICFIDTPGIDGEQMTEHVLRELDALLLQNCHSENMSDNQLLNLFSGEGGTYVDAVLYLLEPSMDPVSESEQSLLRSLSAKTNLIPLIGHADSSSLDDLGSYREKIRKTLGDINVDWYSVFETNPTNAYLEPFAVSSAVVDDSETMDASLLMASDYLPPLLPSDLTTFLDSFLDPPNIARLRHESTKKFIRWRKGHLPTTHAQPSLSSPRFSGIRDIPSPSSIPLTTELNSPLSCPQNILIPYSRRSPSPSSPLPPQASVETSSQALARHNSLAPNPSRPFSEIRLAKWAQDLHRSLAKDRQRYSHLPTPTYQYPASDALDNDNDKDKALAPPLRPARGRLGGEIAVIDPSDPLGILAALQFLHGRRWWALQLSAAATLVYCFARNWAGLQEWFGGGGYDLAPVAVAMPAPTQKGVLEEVWGKVTGGWW